MKFNILICIILLTVSFSSQSAQVWTDGNAYGKGKEVVVVYPQFAVRKVIFRTTDGKLYTYYWGESEQITPNAQAVMSLLLTAITTKKKVSFYYDDSVSNYIPVSLINIHN